MFQNITTLSYKRSPKEAFGFYLAFLLLGLILGGIAVGVAGIQSRATTFSQGFHSGLGAGALVGVAYSLIISVCVLIQKKLYKNFGYIVLALLSGILAILGGSLLGLIIPAFMTTRAAKK